MKAGTTCINQVPVLQFMRLLLAGFIALILSSCVESTGVDDANNSNASTTEVMGDMTIANAVYFDKRTPDGFYQEELQPDAFYSISHVKNIDLLAPENRDGLPVYDLGSDDFIEAMQWSEQAAANQPVYKQLVDNSERMLYQQFTRVDPALPQFIQQHRVFKASVLDRNAVDENYQGRITLAEKTAEKVKLIIEYLWMFTFSNNYGYAVLVSNITETDETFVHIMQQARLELSYSESCDTIEVYEIRYTVPKASGSIWKDEVLTHVISAKRTGSSVEICE